MSHPLKINLSPSFLSGLKFISDTSLIGESSPEVLLDFDEENHIFLYVQIPESPFKHVPLLRQVSHANCKYQ